VETIRGISSIRSLLYYSTLILNQEFGFDPIDMKQPAPKTDDFGSNSKN